MKTVVYLMGLPCTGKSTLLHEWVKQGNAIIPEFINEVPTYVKDAWKLDIDIQIEAQKWILEQYIQKDNLIKNSNDELLLIERCPLDAVVYSRTFGGRVAAWTDSEVSKRKWEPGKIVLLKANQDILRDRLMQGRGLTFEEWQADRAFSNILESHYDSLETTFRIPTLETQDTIGRTMDQLMYLTKESPTFCIETLVNIRSNRERF